MSDRQAEPAPVSGSPLPSRRRGLLGRLAASHLLVASAVLIVVALWLPRVVERFEVSSLERQSADQARLVRRLVSPLLLSPRPAPVQPLARQIGAELRARVTIIRADGRVLADSISDPATMANQAHRPEIRDALRIDPQRSMGYSHAIRANRLEVAVPLFRGQGSGPRGQRDLDQVPGPNPQLSTLNSQPPALAVVRLSLPLDQVHRDGLQVQRALLLGWVLAALATIGVSVLMARSLVQPLRALRDVALGLAHGDLSRRAELRSQQDEIGELAETFNQMASRLQHTIDLLARDRRQMRAVFDTMTDGLLVTDAAGTVRLLNPAAARLLRVTAREGRGQTVLEVTLDASLQALAEEVLRTGSAGMCERSLYTPLERVVSVSAVPIGSGEGAPPEGVVLVFHDLTAARRVERMRRDFVANASHELRTPLTSMRVMVETLLTGAREDPEAAHHFLQVLERELQRMTALVNDLLELSRLDARIESAPTESIPLAALAAELELAWQAVAGERELRLAVSIPEGLAVRGDAQGIRQILGNLLDNALKYTPPGGEIRVSAREKAGRVLLEVADTGIGIPMADRDRIFERFYRVDKDRSRDLGGTGLGLSIVKHLVQAYGGTVSVESRLNRGSTFRVELLSAWAEEPAPAEEPGATASDLAEPDAPVASVSEQNLRSIR